METFQVKANHLCSSPMNAITRTLENQFNRINDWDGTWFGFHWLKPAQDQRMSSRTVCLLSSFYAPVTAPIATIPSFLVGGIPATTMWSSSLAAAGFLVVLQSLSAFFWNRRAAAIRETEVADQR